MHMHTSPARSSSVLFADALLMPASLLRVQSIRVRGHVHSADVRFVLSRVLSRVVCRVLCLCRCICLRCVLVPVLGVSQVCTSTRLGVDYIEDMLYKQIVAAIGKVVGPVDFQQYVRFHMRKL